MDTNKLTLETLLKNKNAFIDVFSEFYPIPLDLLEKYNYVWEWKKIIYNNRIIWTAEVFKNWEARWNWRMISSTENIKWTQELVENFSDKIWWADPFIDHGCWASYMMDYSVINSPDFLWTPALFEKVKDNVENHFKFLEKEFAEEGVKFSEKEYWTYDCQTNNWLPDFFDFLYKKEQQEGIKTINWENICGYAQYLWSDEFVEKYFDILVKYITYYKGGLCDNPHFPWDKYLHKFIDFLDERGWLQLHQNHTFTPNISILEKYKNVWSEYDWENLGKTIRLDINILSDFEDKWSFDQLSFNPTLTSAMVEKYKTKPWRWDHLNDIKYINSLKESDINKYNEGYWAGLFNPEFTGNLNITDFADDELLELFLENSHL